MRRCASVCGNGCGSGWGGRFIRVSGIVNFQSAKTTGVGGEQQRGYGGVPRKLEIAASLAAR